MSDQAVVDCPYRRHVLEAIVVGDDDIGLPDECVEVRSGGRILRAKTDSKGWCRFEGLEPTQVELSLYRLDGKAWELVTGIALPPARLTSSIKDADWRPDPNDPPAVIPARTLKAGRGESISTIAIAHGFTPGQVWKHGGNTPATIEKEVRGEVLSLGQAVELPDRRRRWESVAVDKRYYLHRIAVPFSLTIRFLDGVGRPRRELPYLLRVVMRSGSDTISRCGATDLDGYLVESIPPDSTSGELLVVGGDPVERYPLQLAALEPVTSVGGAQQRLNNLGYWCGDRYGTAGEGTREALRQFQRRSGLTETGEADEQTRALLLAVHRS